VPIMERWKIFEMPVPGYFGFPAFALECFTTYVFVRLLSQYVVSAFRRTDGPAEAALREPQSGPELRRRAGHHMRSIAR